MTLSLVDRAQPSTQFAPNFPCKAQFDSRQHTV